MTRDVAPRMKLRKPALIHSRFFPGLMVSVSTCSMWLAYPPVYHKGDACLRRLPRLDCQINPCKCHIVCTYVSVWYGWAFGTFLTFLFVSWCMRARRKLLQVSYGVHTCFGLVPGFPFVAFCMWSTRHSMLVPGLMVVSYHALHTRPAATT